MHQIQSCRNSKNDKQEHIWSHIKSGLIQPPRTCLRDGIKQVDFLKRVMKEKIELKALQVTNYNNANNGHLADCWLFSKIIQILLFLLE